MVRDMAVGVKRKNHLEKLERQPNLPWNTGIQENANSIANPG